MEDASKPKLADLSLEITVEGGEGEGKGTSNGFSWIFPRL